jgi:16S rRNA A1518/A1519 N6-dimethyltransferase RsmA/KsgA/DIM1 with predicted DNA glycosylase/AP lyase activity
MCTCKPGYERLSINANCTGIICYTFINYTTDITVQCSLVKPPPSVQSVVWRYNEFGDKLRDIENRKSCDQMKR